ncbi:DUF4014 family protein [Escherichia coli]
MKHYLRKKLPTKSRNNRVSVFILFIVLMIPISPLLLVWIIGRTFEPVIELYTDVTWQSFSALHNKINPYKEN